MFQRFPRLSIQRTAVYRKFLHYWDTKFYQARSVPVFQNGPVLKQALLGWQVSRFPVNFIVRIMYTGRALAPTARKRAEKLIIRSPWEIIAEF